MSPTYVYFDSNAFERLTKKGTERDWNEFLNECDKHQINAFNNFMPIFTPFVLLERIGLGEALKDFIKSPGYRGIVELIQSFTINLKSVDPNDLSQRQKIATILDSLQYLLMGLLLQWKDLSIPSILQRLKIEIDQYATSPAAKVLIEKTLVRYYNYLAKTSNHDLFIRDLVWNLITTFPFINIEEETKKTALPAFETSTLWLDPLFAYAHRSTLEGSNVTFARLISYRFYLYAKAVEKDKNHPQSTLATKNLSEFVPYKPYSDLCDGELIHFATLGTRTSSTREKVICFTCDDVKTITSRLAVMKSSLEDAQRDVENWGITPHWGEVYCLSKKGLSMEIVHKFLHEDPQLATAP